MNYTNISISKNSNKLAKMAQFSKFKLPFASKQNINGGQFYKEISKFGLFQKVGKKLQYN